MLLGMLGRLAKKKEKVKFNKNKDNNMYIGVCIIITTIIILIIKTKYLKTHKSKKHREIQHNKQKRKNLE